VEAVIRRYKYTTDRPILVCGIHRSGTSMVAGVLFKLGVFMGEMFGKRNKLSPRGYFEDLEFGKNDKAYNANEITKKQWIQNIKTTVQKRKDNPVPPFTRWGWKAPAARINIEDYIRLANPEIIWCQREREANIKSLERMFGYMIDEKTNKPVRGEDLYEYGIEKYELVKDRCLTIQMENILSNPQYEVGRIAGYLGIESDPLKAIDHIVQDNYAEESYTNYL